MATEAAVEVAWIEAFSSDITQMPPDVVVTVGTLARYASTSLSIVLVASDRPMETDTDPPPLTEMARDAAPTLAMMVEVSLALKATLAALRRRRFRCRRRPGPPRVHRDLILGIGARPLTANPAPRPPATAAVRASTVALILWFEVAVTV